MKKLVSVLLCIAMMFTFLSVISFAAEDASAGSSVVDLLLGLLKGVDWASIIKVLAATIQTFLRMIGAGA